MEYLILARALLHLSQGKTLSSQEVADVEYLIAHPREIYDSDSLAREMVQELRLIRLALEQRNAADCGEGLTGVDGLEAS